MNWKREAREKLQEYGWQKDSLKNMRDRIAAIECEKQAIKVVNSDSEPIQGGMNKYEDRLLNLMCEQKSIELTYEAIEIRVGIMEKALKRLDYKEKRTLEEFFVNNNAFAVKFLMSELGYEQRNIYKIRDTALHKLTLLLYGITHN